MFVNFIVVLALLQLIISSSEASKTKLSKSLKESFEHKASKIIKIEELVCPGQPAENFCDCTSDCGTSICDCAQGLSCCSDDPPPETTSVPEIQAITISASSTTLSGTFCLSFNGESTVAIWYHRITTNNMRLISL
jgi:hypothetical protein